MQTNLAEFVKPRAEHDELEKILRSCVHCGFCNATCPTYQLTGDELDGPRGRIYLIKQMLEGGEVGRITQRHLDRCLSCQSCETTCPSGVEYGRLLDLGRVMLEEKVTRTIPDQIKRSLMLAVFPYRVRFKCLMRVARLFKSLLPARFKKKIPENIKTKEWPQAIHDRKVLILSGCVQPTLNPAIDNAAAGILDKLGISLICVAASGCCGALSYHLSKHKQAKQFARKNIDVCWPIIEQGVEAIIMTSSGCGVMLKDYETLLQYDKDYAEKAKRFSEKVMDISEILINEDLSSFIAGNIKVAYQSPCTLQHGQKLPGLVEKVLQKIGYSLTAVKDAHLCCGSAGVYSLLQPELSEQLKRNKLKAIQDQQPDVVATSNIGCLTQLQNSAKMDVVHWLELLDGKY